MKLVEIVNLLTVGAQITLSLVSNAVFGGIGGVSCRYTQRFSPSREAFGIWLPIYILSYLIFFEQLTVDVHLVPNVFYGLSWLFASFWTPAFTTNTPRGILCAAVFLVLSSLCSLTAVMVGRLWFTSSWVTASAFSLLAGWTLVAASLNVGIAYSANDNKPDPECSDYTEPSYTIMGPIDAQYETIVPLTLAVVIAPISFFLSDPVLPVPIWWALLWNRAHKYNYVAFAAASATIVASVSMLYFVHLGVPLARSG
tara:strand:- start:72 stop:836 length:765 start_codon:yes stop_codon:yes gene_type:complete